MQIDTCKIRPGLYQFTAIDDCSRFLVAFLARRRSAHAKLMFLDQVYKRCRQTYLTLSLISAQPFAQRRPRDAKTPAHRARISRVQYARTQLRRRASARLLSSINKDHPSLMRLLWLWGCGQRDALSIESTDCPIR